MTLISWQNGGPVFRGGKVGTGGGCCCTPISACCCVDGVTLNQDSFPGYNLEQMQTICESCSTVYVCWIGSTVPVIVASCDECTGEGNFCIPYSGQCGTFYGNCDSGSIYSLWINYVTNGTDECPTLPTYDGGTFATEAECLAALAALEATPPEGACDISYETSTLCAKSCVDTNEFP